MLMMPIFTPLSDIYQPQKEQLMLMMLALSPPTYILLSQEVLLMLVMLALRPRVPSIGHGNCK